MVADLSNAKAFTRRVGITYEEIIEILKTRFINPSSTLLPQLERFGVPFSTLKTLKESPLTGQAWLALLPKPLPDAWHYGGNIERWVKNEANFARIMGLITLTTPIVPRAASRLIDAAIVSDPPHSQRGHRLFTNVLPRRLGRCGTRQLAYGIW